jgi:hypothetical protein
MGHFQPVDHSSYYRERGWYYPVMTETQNAITEAIKRWGPMGNAWTMYSETESNALRRVYVYYVGVGIQGDIHMVAYGQGKDYRAAFENATHNGH